MARPYFLGTIPAFAVSVLVVSQLGGCLSEEDSSAIGGNNDPGSPGNAAPQISGTPTSALNFGNSYSFTPNASDPDGDALAFSITNSPLWAEFNASSGHISGLPTLGHVGTYSNIEVTVSDGAASATLGPFTITVNAVSNGSVTLNWSLPTENEDGSMLMDLAGFNIYWGTTRGSYPNSVMINNASISTYVVDNLSPGSYDFVATSFNTSGVESAYSNATTKVVP